MAKNSTIIRANKEFDKFIKDLLEKKPRKVTTSRLTLAIKRQYDKYPFLLKELNEADLK